MLQRGPNIEQGIYKGLIFLIGVPIVIFSLTCICWKYELSCKKRERRSVHTISTHPTGSGNNPLQGETHQYDEVDDEVLNRESSINDEHDVRSSGSSTGGSGICGVDSDGTIAKIILYIGASGTRLTILLLVLRVCVPLTCIFLKYKVFSKRRDQSTDHTNTTHPIESGNSPQQVVTHQYDEVDEGFLNRESSVNDEHDVRSSGSSTVGSGICGVDSVVI
ncbi:unnamed protein product [Mytilus coruscus]|uniref:Uncharacterized protein n=1 Tax=Mytilus coruscus TaxID=42192 RepID=A0A6J8DCT7_MYTCO|nr:unnamed protein product [Mytilus coruscus]